MTTAPPLSSLQSVPGVTMSYSEHNARDYMPAPLQPDIPETSEASKVANALKARKRTKTGCLSEPIRTGHYAFSWLIKSSMS